MKKLLSKFFLRRKKPLAIIIRGAPSSGKTSVAKELKSLIPETVIISVDSLIAMQLGSFDKMSEEYVEAWRKEQPYGMEIAEILTKYFLTRGKNVVVEEVFFVQPFLDQIVKAAKKKGETIVVELVVPLKAVLKREKGRGSYWELKPVQQMYEEIVNNPYPGSIRIDSAQLSPKECAERILKEVRYDRK